MNIYRHDKYGCTLGHDQGQNIIHQYLGQRCQNVTWYYDATQHRVVTVLGSVRGFCGDLEPSQKLEWDLQSQQHPILVENLNGQNLRIVKHRLGHMLIGPSLSYTSVQDLHMG